MIDAAKLTVTGLPGSSDAGAILSSEEAGVDTQLSEIKEVKFDDALLSQLSEQSEVDVSTLSDLLLSEQEILPDGKDLPLMPLSDQTEEAVLSLTSEPDLPLQDEGEEIIAGQALVLPFQLAQDRPGEKKTGTNVTQEQRQTRVAMPVALNDQVDTLTSDAGDETVVKMDTVLKSVNVAAPDMPMTERPAETTAILSTGVSAKLNPSESINQTTSMPRLSIDAPVQQAKWGDNLAGRVAWMVMNNQQSAQISLNPAELGPIEVKISLHQDKASVNFYAHNNTVRDAIEEAFPRLRDMFSDNGINLSQSSVSDQSLSQRQGYSETGRQEHSAYPYMEEGDIVDKRLDEVVNIKLGLVDHFV